MMVNSGYFMLFIMVIISDNGDDHGQLTIIINHHLLIIIHEWWWWWMAIIKSGTLMMFEWLMINMFITISMTFILCLINDAYIIVVHSAFRWMVMKGDQWDGSLWSHLPKNRWLPGSKSIERIPLLMVIFVINWSNSIFDVDLVINIPSSIHYPMNNAPISYPINSSCIYIYTHIFQTIIM